MTAAVSLHSVSKHFGEFIALEEVSFEIADNEFFTLLGPSALTIKPDHPMGARQPFCTR